MIDTDALRAGEFVTVYGNAGPRGPCCPQCRCERTGPLCYGCGFEWGIHYAPSVVRTHGASASVVPSVRSRTEFQPGVRFYNKEFGTDPAEEKPGVEFSPPGVDSPRVAA